MLLLLMQMHEAYCWLALWQVEATISYIEWLKFLSGDGEDGKRR